MCAEDLGNGAGRLVDILEAVDDRVSARTQRDVLRGVVLRKRNNAGGLNDLGEPQRRLIETRTERIPNRLYAGDSDTPGEDRGRAVRPRIIDHEVLGAGDAGVGVHGDVTNQIGWIAVTPVHAVPRGESLLLRDVVVDLRIDLVVCALIDSLGEEVVDARKRIACRRGRGVVRIEFPRDRVLPRKRNHVSRDRAPHRYAARVYERVIRIVDCNQVAVCQASVRKIARQLLSRGNGARGRGCPKLLIAVEVGEEKRAVLPVVNLRNVHRTADGSTVVIALGVR